MALVKELMHQHIGSGPILKALLQTMGFQSDPVSVQSLRELATESPTRAWNDTSPRGRRVRWEDLATRPCSRTGAFAIGRPAGTRPAKWSPRWRIARESCPCESASSSRA
jgi:hypothetical protein